jgi:hypothetical protein
MMFMMGIVTFGKGKGNLGENLNAIDVCVCHRALPQDLFDWRSKSGEIPFKRFLLQNPTSLRYDPLKLVLRTA